MIEQPQNYSANSMTPILLVDDDIAQRGLLRMILEREGYHIVEAANGREALSISEKKPNIRMIITDLDMPEMGGLDLIQEIRKRQIKYKYIIVLTSTGDKSSAIKALSVGADDFLRKPASPEELRLRTSSGFRLLNLESTEELIFAMAKLSEYRSEETGFHLERVQHYIRVLARDTVEHCPELEITSPLAEEIAWVSSLHDIGKVAIPDAILHKPGRLTPDEYDEIKEHAKIGGELLRTIYEKTGSHSIKTAYEIALYHHERFDGTGYPKGLAGDAIPVSARIMALADIYDALTSERSYKKALSHEKAKEIILEERGKHLDPRLVDAFLRQEEFWKTIRERFSD
jgi:putative two-component system response regulator